MSMESFKPFNPLEISGETPEDISGLKKINEAIIPRKEAPLIPPGGEADVTERGAREKVFAAFSGEVAVSYENNEDRKRRELELSARNFFAKMSTENLLRKPTKEVGVSYNPDKKFEGLEPITQETFQIAETPGITFSEEVYYKGGRAYARVAMINDGGKKLYIDNLLPDGVRLVPVALDISPDEGESVASKIAAYKMADDRHPGNFFYGVNINDRRVIYNNLKGKEGVSALFHEVSHTWNDEAGLAGTAKWGNSTGQRLKSAWGEVYGYFTGTSTFQKTLENKISEERDAWAHGFRMMRFLKSNGFPLYNPEMSGGLKKMAENCLSSYEGEHARNMEKFKPRRRFVSGARESAAKIAAHWKLDRELDALFADMPEKEERVA